MRVVGAEGLRAAGLPTETAYALAGTEHSVVSVAGAGTAIGDATAITGDLVLITSGDGNSGVQLPDAPIGSFVFVSNCTANTIYVYPDSSSNAIFSGAATTGTAAAAYTSLTTGKDAVFVKGGTTTAAWRAILIN